MKSPILITVALALGLAPLLGARAAPEKNERVAEATEVSVEAAKAWGFDKSDLKPDPAVRFGVLPNGMRYAIMRNKTPQHSASVRLRIDAGSTAEAADQQGLAHFLEHMAFNGSKRVPEGEMIKLLERNGLSFGADTNAYTSFSETVYQLDLPEVNDALIDTSLMLMRETASELTLSRAAVDRERGVIMGEMRARDSYGQRLAKDELGFMVPGTPLADHMTIGSEAVIKGAPVARIRDVYERFYSPERATLIFVGDIDPAQIEARIVKKFGDWKAKNKQSQDPTKGTVDPNRAFATHFFADPNVPTIVSINAVKPFDVSPDSAQRRRRDLVKQLGAMMLNRRLEKLARLADAPFTNGSAGNSGLLTTAEVTSVDFTARDGDWKRALATGEQELRRALTHGFTAAELKEQIANTRTALKNGAEQAPTRQSAGLANGLAASVEQKKVFTTPQQSYDRFQSYADGITLQEVNDTYRALWANTQALIHVSNKTPVADAEKEIASVWKTSAAVAVVPPASNDNQAFAYTNFGAIGTVADDKRIADLDIRTIRFANNVRLNIKKTDFEKGRVRVSVRVGGGLLELPREIDGLGAFMGFAYARGGTEKHSIDDMQSILSGRSVSWGLSASTDAFVEGAVTTPADLELQMQVMAADITSPGYRAEAEAQWRNTVGVFMEQVRSQPGAVAGTQVPRLLASGDSLFGLGDEATLKARGFKELKPALASSLATGPIEIAIVGDVNETQAIEAVAKTFGALPARSLTHPDYAKDHSVRFIQDRKPITLTHSGKPEQALAQTYWPTTDGMDFERAIRLEVLSEVMGIMATEELREKMGATYSPNASSVMSDTFKGFGYLSISSTTEPKLVDAIFTGIDGIASKLVAKPISEDLLKRARAPMLERLARNQRENGFWMGFVDEAQSLPKDLESLRNWKSFLSRVTPAALQTEAKLWLKPGAALRVRVLPQ
jgi:zinc protease